MAVSGGSDSTALMHLAAGWARSRGIALNVATVDHRLRPTSGAEAAAVVAAAAALGLPADVLRWEGWSGTGNLQAAARAARYGLLACWAGERGLAAVALGHTRDDQAETVLLRLARGSGVDGLSAMAESTARRGTVWLRPLLGLGRETLRAWLRARGLDWTDDPSNDDPRFHRVRARAALAALAPLGLDAERLAETARRLRQARAVLDDAATALAADALHPDACGALHLRLAPMRAAHPETALRLLAEAFRCVAASPYPPRRAALDALWARIGAGAGGSLHGCLAGQRRGTLWIAREPAAAADRSEGDLWDGRWRIGTAADGHVGALGEPGLAALRTAARAGLWTDPPGWAASPRAARLTTPALWRDGRLACAPLAAYGEGLQVSWTGRLPFGAVAR